MAGKGKGKGKKAAEKQPSREEMHAVVANMLKEVDFNTVSTNRVILSQVANFLLLFTISIHSCNAGNIIRHSTTAWYGIPIPAICYNRIYPVKFLIQLLIVSNVLTIREALWSRSDA